MILKELKPIRQTKSEYDAIEKKIKELFKKEIYTSLLREFTHTERFIQNAREDVREALRTGRLTYYKGKFSGKLNASLSKELRELGAQWLPSQKCFSIPKNKLPVEIQSAIASSATTFERKIERIDRKLASILPEELASKLKISKIFDRTLWKVEDEFQKSVKNITIAPTLTPREAERIAEEWQNNMHLWIKDFTAEQIQKLRTDLQKSVLAGNRYESAVKSIQASYGVTERKAKFLARQETALLMAKHKEVRYEEAGVYEYRWQAVVGTPAHPTRKRHKFLSGKIFRFDNPPNSVEIKGQDTRPTHEGPGNGFNNAGTDYNCRCTVSPLIRLKK